MMQNVVGEKPVTVRLEPTVYRRVEVLAKREKRSVSAQIAYLVDLALATLPADQVPEPEQPDRRPRRRQ